MQQMLHFLEQMRWKSNKRGGIYTLTSMFNLKNGNYYEHFK
jgi:hypothetical protein